MNTDGAYESERECIRYSAIVNLELANERLDLRVLRSRDVGETIPTLENQEWGARRVRKAVESGGA